MSTSNDNSDGGDRSSSGANASKALTKQARVRRANFASVANDIFRKTRNGEDLVDWARRIMDDDLWDVDDEGQKVRTRVPLALRMQAHHWLADRAIGKAVQSIDIAARIEQHAAETVKAVDLTHLSREELRAVCSALNKAVEVEGTAEELGSLPASDEGGEGSSGDG